LFGGGPTVSEYLEQWLDARRHSIRPKTHEGYRTALAGALAAFGEQRLDRLAKVHLVEMDDDMRAPPRQAPASRSTSSPAFMATTR
jgi:hypothetical protein